MMNGRRVGSLIMVSVLASGLSACVTMRRVELAGDGALPATIEIGDRVSVVDARGSTTGLVVTAVGAGFVEGTAADDRQVRIAAEDIQELHKRDGAVGRTVGLGVGVGLALFIHGLSQGAIGAW